MKLKIFATVLQYLLLQVNPFQQTDYRVVHEWVSVDWYNSSYVKDLKFVMFHYTRYQKRFNATGTLLQDLGHGITNEIQGYKFQSNEYREFPMFYKDNACDTLKLDLFKTNPVHFNSNGHGCPLRKGFYYLYNAYLNDSNLPPFVPRGRYMMSLKVYYNGTILLARGKWYGAIQPTNPLERVI